MKRFRVNIKAEVCLSAENKKEAKKVLLALLKKLDNVLAVSKRYFMVIEKSKVKVEELPF